MKATLLTKRLSILAAVLALFAVPAFAQQKAPPASPAAKDSVVIGGKTISVKYSSPGVKGRDIFSKTGLVSKDGTYPIWRAGANNATAFHTDAALMIGNLHVPAGDYTLYANVADPDAWELVVSKQTGQWGTVYKADMDLGRVKMKMSKPAQTVERLYYKLEATGKDKGMLTLAWENHAGSVNFMVH